jgi:hypothetical protein
MHIREKKKHTISWAKMHTTKFLESKTQKTSTIMYLNLPQKVTNNMLDQQAIDKKKYVLLVQMKTPKKSTFNN